MSHLLHPDGTPIRKGDGKVVDIITLSLSSRPSLPLLASNAMMLEAKKEGVDIASPHCPGSSVLHEARNHSLQKIRANATHVLFMDDDMVPSPDSLMRLLEEDVDVISALTTTKGQPPKMVLRVWSENAQTFVPMPSIPRDTLISGTFRTGLGFILFKVLALDAVCRYWAEARDWLSEMRPMFERIHATERYVERERERIAQRRGKMLEQGEALGVFGFARTEAYTTSTENILYEDTKLAWCLKNLNIPVHVHTGVHVGHQGNMVYHAGMLRGCWEEDSDTNDNALVQEENSCKEEAKPS